MHLTPRSSRPLDAQVEQERANQMNRPIRAIVVDRQFMDASSMLNPNAFPDGIRVEVEGCAHRLAILAHSAAILQQEHVLDKIRLLREIRTSRAFDTFMPIPEKPIVLSLQNRTFLTGLFAALIACKSFLDLYAKVIARLVAPSARVRGFNKRKYNGQELPGGNILALLETSTPATFERRDALVAVLLRHIRGWAHDAITYRDHVAHEGDIPGLDGAFVHLQKPLDALREEDVVAPRMPHGEAVGDYCARLVYAVRNLIRETLPLLPNVRLD